MRKLIDYIRSCFCKHEWEVKQNEIQFYLNKPVGYKWSYYKCKKCGYFKRYKSC